MELIFISRPIWGWDGTNIEVGWTWLELVGGDTLLGWRWDANIDIWMETRRNMDGGCMLIYGYCQRSDRTWKELRQESCELDAVDTGLAWRWKARIKFWIALRWCLDRSEMRFSGTGCSRDVTWIEVRHKYQDLHWGEIHTNSQE